MNENSQNTIKYKDFAQFYEVINQMSNTYHSKFVSDNYNIPRNLQLSIDNYSHFIDTFEALVKDKLYIRCFKDFDHDRLFYNYILPTSVFLHYLNVDISILSEINIFIVNDKTYELYRENIGGEYAEASKRFTRVKTHLIIIKDYEDQTEFNDALSLIALFHELTHLVDNIDFNGLKQDRDLEYNYRISEIKAKHLSEFFYAFYQCKVKYIPMNHTFEIIHEYNIDIKEDLVELYDSIVYQLDFNYDYINSDLQFGFIDNIWHTSKQNIQYLKSIQQITDLLKFLNSVESLLK